MADRKQMPAAELRKNLALYAEVLVKDRDDAAARCVRRRALDIRDEQPFQEWQDWQLALDYLAISTDGEFGERLAEQPPLPEPLPVYQLRSDACPACKHRGRTFTTATRLYGCPVCPHTSTERNA